MSEGQFEMPGDLHAGSPQGRRWRGPTAVREAWPEDKGSGIISLEDTAESTLPDALPRREHLDEKRNPQAETPKEPRERLQPAQVTPLENCYQIPEQ